MLIETAAVLELLFFTWAWARRRQAQKWQMFTGRNDSIRLPLMDDYLKQRTSGASRLERFAASRLARGVRRRRNSINWAPAPVLRAEIHRP